jgi:tRNA (guanine37-N1)-methyltransferase
VAARLSTREHLVLLCGRYEGVDERVLSRVDEEISIGDYVLSGGELPALVVLEAVARFVPGVVGDDQSVAEDSFSRGLLDFPHYTRPAEVGAERVPDVLLSGNHAEIRRWRKRESLARTLARRPKLLKTAALDDEERALLVELQKGRIAESQD